MRRYRVEMTSTNRETCTHALAAPNRGAALYQAILDHQDQGHRQDVADIVVTAESKPFDRGDAQYLDALRAVGVSVIADPEPCPSAATRAILAENAQAIGRDIIAELIDYAERYAEVNDEPKGGGCRSAIARARGFLSGAIFAAPPEEHQEP